MVLPSSPLPHPQPPPEDAVVADPLIAVDPLLLVERAASLLERESGDWQSRLNATKNPLR